MSEQELSLFPEDTEARLTRWRPTMREYHSGPEISSGFLSAVQREGLSAALCVRAQDGLTTDRRMGRGAWLHALFTGDTETRIHVAPASVKVRRGRAWEDEVYKAKAMQADTVLLVADVLVCWNSWRSLCGPLEEWPAWRSLLSGWAHNAPGMDDTTRFVFREWLRRDLDCPRAVDTPAKQQIRAILRRWSPRLPEVSHRWNPLEVPGATCRIRQDLVTQAPSGQWYDVQLKTTETPLTTWWPYWRRWVREGSAFYRAGMKNLFGDESFCQLLVVARMVEPWPWAIFSLEPRAEELEETWRGEVLPRIEWISDALARGDCYGPEEKGLTL